MNHNVMNAAAKVVEDKMAPQEGVPTSHVSNPSNEPDKFADPSGDTMQALAWQARNKVEMVEAKKPKLVDEEDVLLRVTGSTICGSDLHLLHGAIIELEKGDILGHEFMGIVESCGPKVTKVKPGDRVVACFDIACGKCYMCKNKLFTACIKTNSSSLHNAMYGNRTSGFFGYSHFVGGFSGGQSEWVRVPWANANLLKLPESVPDEAGLYLSDVLSTSYHCVVDTGVKEGDIVGVWGLGPIGLLAAKWSFLKGASRVIAIDNVQWRLDYAKEKIPQIETLNFDEYKDVAKRINEITAPGDPNSFENSRPPGLDVALECSAGEYAKGLIHKVETAIGLENDSSEILNECIASVINFGSIGITGVYTGFTNHFNIGAIMEKGVRLIGNGQSPTQRHWETILNDYIIPGKIDVVDLIVTHRIPLEKVAEFYTRLDKREEGIMKTFVATKFSSPPSAGAPQSLA
ncbi:hypothetical protein P7C70_g6945, partial [Phenoliferia sp. Uapishka_3]